ncbi:MAG: universal stress protein [Bacteroidota bacterium]
MNKILIPIDFSPSSLSALQLGITFGKMMKAEIMVLHVAEPSGLEPFLPMVLEQALKRKRRKEAEMDLAKWLEGWKQPQWRKHGIKHKLAYGPTKEAIKEVASEWGADLLVMGFGKDPNGKSKRLGSTAINLLNTAELNILLVPPISNFMPLREIGYLMKSNERLLENIDDSLSIAKSLGAKFFCIQSDFMADSPLEQILRRAFREELEKGCMEYVAVEEGTEMYDLKSLIKLYNMDLLAIGRQEKSLLLKWFTQPVEAQLMEKLWIPILVFAEEKKAKKNKNGQNGHSYSRLRGNQVNIRQ